MLTQPASSVELPTLGVGLLYNSAVPEFLSAHPGQIDYLEVIPDTFWTDRGRGARERYEEIESTVEMLDRFAFDCPVVGHNVGFSLGSADSFDSDYAQQVAAWQQRYAFPWHSDHLSFARVSDHDGIHDAGLAVPVPYDRELLDLIADRIRSIQRQVSAPFLVENNVYFIDIPEQEMTEPEFLNTLAGETGCGLLLDLHNVYANARNHGFDAMEFIGELDLSRVAEIHIAGGNELGGMYADSHAGPCPEPVWDLLEATAPMTSNLRGVTFEFHDSYYPLLGLDGISRELSRARSIFDRCRTD